MNIAIDAFLLSMSDNALSTDYNVANSVILNEELKEISLWLKAKKLSLNIKKTHFMICSSKNGAHPNVYINVDGESISENLRQKFFA